MLLTPLGSRVTLDPGPRPPSFRELVLPNLLTFEIAAGGFARTLFTIILALRLELEVDKRLMRFLVSRARFLDEVEELLLVCCVGSGLLFL